MSFASGKARLSASVPRNGGTFITAESRPTTAPTAALPSLPLRGIATAAGSGASSNLRLSTPIVTGTRREATTVELNLPRGGRPRASGFTDERNAIGRRCWELLEQRGSGGSSAQPSAADAAEQQEQRAKAIAKAFSEVTELLENQGGAARAAAAKAKAEREAAEAEERRKARAAGDKAQVIDSTEVKRGPRIHEVTSSLGQEAVPQ